MIIITTDEVRDSLREYLDEKTDPVRDNEHSMNPFPKLATFGTPIFTLPESAFEGLETEDNEPVNVFYASYKQKQRLLPYWEGLKAGMVKLADVPLDHDAPGNSMVDAFMTAQKLKEPGRYIPFPAPITPAVERHLARLVNTEPSEEVLKIIERGRKCVGARLCLVLIRLALKKHDEGEICNT